MSPVARFDHEGSLVVADLSFLPVLRGTLTCKVLTEAANRKVRIGAPAYALVPYSGDAAGTCRANEPFEMANSMVLAEVLISRADRTYGRHRALKNPRVPKDRDSNVGVNYVGAVLFLLAGPRRPATCCGLGVCC